MATSRNYRRIGSGKSAYKEIQNSSKQLWKINLPPELRPDSKIEMALKREIIALAVVLQKTENKIKSVMEH